MLPEDLLTAAQKLVALYTAKNLKLSTAESCTGGLIAAAITSISGASAVFDAGFITYSNAMKTELLGVDAALIQTNGAVSEETAKAMAEGARKKSRADFSIAVTGIAGPAGGTPEKPAGLVYIALASSQGSEARRFQFQGSRMDVQNQTAIKALSWLFDVAEK